MLKSSIPLSAALIAATVAGYSANDSRQYRNEDSRDYDADDSRQSDDYYDPCCTRLEFWFDPMGVKPCQMVLEFAEEHIAQSDVVNNNFNKFLDPSFSFGFKIGAELVSNCPTWVFGAQYMWWENTTKGSDTLRGTDAQFGGEFTILDPALSNTQGFNIVLPAAEDVGSVNTRLEYKYNLLDVYGGWNCCACGGLQLTPYGGFRGWWYSTEVQELSKQTNLGTFSETGDLSTATNCYDAFGIMGGLGFEWNICGQFYFFGSFGGSLVSGNNHNEINLVATGPGFSQTSPNVIDIPAGTTVTFDQNQCLFVHSIEGKFGFNWNFCWCDVDYLIGAYYEVVQWNKVLPHPFRLNSTSPGTATKTLNGLFLHQIAGRIGISF